LIKKIKKNKKVVDKPFQICYNKYVKKQNKQKHIKKVEDLIMANKITKREVINSMLANEVIASNETYVAYLQNELALLDKKAQKKGKSDEELAELSRLKSVVTETLATVGKGTVSEIQKANSELAELSNQKVTSLLKSLIEEGMVVKTVEGRKSIFSLV
jgi:hypothetical protein